MTIHQLLQQVAQALLAGTGAEIEIEILGPVKVKVSVKGGKKEGEDE